MTGNKLGTRLSRLVRARAYLSEKVLTAERSVAALKADLRAARAAHTQLQTRLTDIDADIARLPAIRIEDIQPIRLTPRLLETTHGAFNACLVELLKENGDAICTRQIVGYMAATFDLPVATLTERENTRRRVVRRLREFVAKRAVVRLHDPADNAEGRWLWTGIQDGDGAGAGA